jgi:hypothetical protein
MTTIMVFALAESPSSPTISGGGLYPALEPVRRWRQSLALTLCRCL